MKKKWIIYLLLIVALTIISILIIFIVLKNNRDNNVNLDDTYMLDKKEDTSSEDVSKISESPKYIDNVIIVNKSYPLPRDFVPDNLVSINERVQVTSETYEAFELLQSDAIALGLNIYASSGYRSYDIQNDIYNNYVNLDGQEIADTYSARAGYSEHQTGLAIDLNTIDMSFDGTDESEFVKNNCYKYGFVIRYPKAKEDITGYMYEPWHIRYVGNVLAEKLYNNGDWITFEEYFNIDSKYE